MKKIDMLYPLYALVTIVAFPAYVFDLYATPVGSRGSLLGEAKYYFVTRWGYFREGGYL